MDLVKAQTLAETLINQHLDPSWSFAWDGAKRRFGQCRYSDRTISLSIVLTKTEPEEGVRNTILHEIAHAKVGIGHGHNATWRSMCYKLGMTDVSRTGDYSETTKATLKPRYVLVDKEGRVLRRYFRKPGRSTFASLPNMYIASDKKNTFGTLKIEPFDNRKHSLT